ncbi:MAG: glycosyltransferase family 4 protein [Nitriliruptoraceae bacterium]|nr:glycosyltransferase family 4 protein [Nitriliruptoraceae bacterium]
MKVLWVTNDLPPRTGGIQQFVGNLVRRVHPHHATVIGPDAGLAGAAHDLDFPVPVVRAPSAVLPTAATGRLITDVARSVRPDVVVLGASWPLGELAGRLRARLGIPIVGLTHGLEAGLARPGLGRLVHRATRDLAAVTSITAFTAERLTPHLGSPRHVRLPPGVDTERFHPGCDGASIRARWAIPDDAPLVGCVSRLVARKGQDALIEAWPTIRRAHPTARLVLVGEGPAASRLQRRAAQVDPRSVVLPGPVAWDELPDTYAALDVFAMPCRTRWAGLDVEGLGIVYLEAQAVGVPVVAGRSGGAPEAVAPGAGTVVDGTDPAAVAAGVIGWLDDPEAARRAGARGVAAMQAGWAWPRIAARFEALLAEVVAGGAAGR